MSVKKTRIWKFFSSVKLAIWIISIIAVLSLVGSLIPQNQDPAFYIDKFGHAGYGLLQKTGLVNTYSSWWFILCLALFSLNLTVCLANRFPIKRHSMGTIFSHLGVLIILAGAFIGMIYGQKALIKIAEGEEVNSFISKGNKIDLGFSVRLDDFIYNEHIDPKEKLLVYPVNGMDPSPAAFGGKAQDDASAKGCEHKPIAQISAEVGNEAEIADTGNKVKVLRYLPDFVMDMSTKDVLSRSAQPNNPAIEVEFKGKDGSIDKFWVFARFPDMHRKEGQTYRFEYNWVGRRPKDFISKVAILKHGNEVLKADILVNKPLKFEGYSFFQSTYDTEGLSWSGVQVVKDPGVMIVYAGFVAIIVGFTIIFYVNPFIRRR